MTAAIQQEIGSVSDSTKNRAGKRKQDKAGKVRSSTVKKNRQG